MMHVAVASHAPHGRKHGAAFADTFASADGATIVAVGEVVAGDDRIAVADLLRTGLHALVTSREALGTALAALDRIVMKHAREHRDDALAAVVAVIAVAPDGTQLVFAGAGQLHCAIVPARGADRTHLHGHDAALGTGFASAPYHAAMQTHALHRGDLVVAATFPTPPPDRADPQVAEDLVRHAGAVDAALALVTIE